MRYVAFNRPLSEYEKKAFQDQWDDYKRYGGAMPIIPNVDIQYKWIKPQKPKQQHFPASLISHCKH